MDYINALNTYKPQIQLAIRTFQKEHPNWRLERDDLSQEVALNLLQSWDRWQAANDMGNYAYGVAVKTCRMAARTLESDPLGYAVQLPEDDEYD